MLRFYCILSSFVRFMVLSYNRYVRRLWPKFSLFLFLSLSPVLVRSMLMLEMKLLSFDVWMSDQKEIHIHFLSWKQVPSHINDWTPFKFCFLPKRVETSHLSNKNVKITFIALLTDDQYMPLIYNGLSGSPCFHFNPIYILSIPRSFNNHISWFWNVVIWDRK